MRDRGLEVGAATPCSLGCMGLLGWGSQAGPHDFEQVGLDVGVDRDVSDLVLVHEAFAAVQELWELHAQEVEASGGAVLDDLGQSGVDPVEEPFGLVEGLRAGLGVEGESLCSRGDDRGLSCGVAGAE